MTRIMAPAAILIAGFMAAPAEAARCPAGQMYRVSLGVCASRAANLRWLNQSSRESDSGDSKADAPKRRVVRAKPKPAVPVPVERAAPAAEPAATAPAIAAPAAEAAAPAAADVAAAPAPAAEPAAPQSKVARAATLKKKFLPKEDPVQALAPADETILLDPLVEAPSPSQSLSPYGTVKGNLF